MASNEKISNIFNDIRKKTHPHIYVPATAAKKNNIELQEDGKIVLTKKK